MHWRGRAAHLGLLAAAAFLAGVSTATLGRYCARRAQADAEALVARHAGELDTATAAALATARARAETLATTALVRTAVETDAVTVRDIARSDRVLQPHAGERIEVYQARDGRTLMPMLHPKLALPRAAGVSRLDGEARVLWVSAWAPVEPLYARGSLKGAIGVSEAVALDGNQAPWSGGAHGLRVATAETALVVGTAPARAAWVSAPMTAVGVPVVVSLPIDGSAAGALIVVGRVMLLAAFALALLTWLRMRKGDESLTEAFALAAPPPTITPPPATATPPPETLAQATPPSYPPLARIQPTRTVRLPVPDDAAPIVVAPEITARQAPHAREDEARRLVLAWSGNDPTPITSLSPFAAESAPVVIDPRADRLQPRYRLIKPIGRGQCADVYLAQSHLPGAPPAVAIKLLSRALPRESIARQLDAARAQMQLTHPHLVRILDVGSDPELPYVTMEYVEGCNLEAMHAALGADPVPAAQAVAIAVALCHALEAARTAPGGPACHGAVKPRNVLVGRRNAIKLADFGAPPSSSDRLAPEQYAGKPSDARTDVYSVGVLLHELLTGERVYPVDGQERRWPALPPPSSRRADVPPALDSVIARATRFMPRWRQADAGILLRELTRAAAGIADTAPSLSDFVERARRSL